MNPPTAPDDCAPRCGGRVGRVLARFVSVGLVTSLLAVVSACASGPVTGQNGGATPEGPATSLTGEVKGVSLTTGQASKLARILFNNHTVGGAEVRADVDFGPAATFHLDGVVDWTNSIGRVVLTTKRRDAVAVPPQTIAWGGSSVYLSVPGLTEALASRGHPGILYLQRPVSVKTNPLDQVITLIASFSSARTENPLLLRQGDTSFEGTAMVGGHDVEKLRFGRSTYSVADDGFAYRIDTTFVSVQGPIVVTFDRHGAQSVEPIDPSKVLPLDGYTALYDSLVSRSL